MRTRRRWLSLSLFFFFFDYMYWNEALLSVSCRDKNIRFLLHESVFDKNKTTLAFFFVTEREIGRPWMFPRSAHCETFSISTTQKRSAKIWTLDLKQIANPWWPRIKKFDQTIFPSKSLVAAWMALQCVFPSPLTGMESQSNWILF